jgi:hypothetical protein
MLGVGLLLLCRPALAQDSVSVRDTTLAKSAARASFDALKGLAGTWIGAVRTEPTNPDLDGPIEVKMRVGSQGNALVHEIAPGGIPEPTLIYLDGDVLTLVHYCDAGNRPRMVGKVSPDGKTLEFEFLDLSGGNQYGHMHHAVFTFIDADHHIEDWTWMGPGDKPVRAHFDLQRTNAGSSTSGN